MTPDKKRTETAIRYLIRSLGDKIEGKKKVMKLMFLLEHYDLETDKLTSKGKLGNKFYVYYYGVFSSDVMFRISNLIMERKITDRFPLFLRDKSEIKIDADLKERIDKIIGRFGEYSGYDLEIKTLEMLGIQFHEKKQYFGKDINEILKEKGSKRTEN